MALKIRLRQQGRTNRAFYRMVVADCRSPRDGKYIESLGWYNPVETELDKTLLVKTERLQHWINEGAQLSEKAAQLIKKVAPGIIADIVKKEVNKQAKETAKRKARKARAKAKA